MTVYVVCHHELTSCNERERKTIVKIAILLATDAKFSSLNQTGLDWTVLERSLKLLTDD